MFGLKPEKISVIYNGLEPKIYPGNAESRRMLGLDQNEFVIACLGRLVKNKGQDVFLEAAALIKNKVNNVKFLIVGDGYLKEYLKRISERLGLTPNVLFFSYEKTPWVFGAMDVSVVPSLSETFSFAVAESMQAGKSIVASKVGGIPELVEDGKTGLLFNPGDINELAKCLTKLTLDKKYAKALGERGKEKIIRRFSLDRMIQETIKIYGAE
jgi:glycosyltransferase involved in cell wall biosynthesis